MTLIEISLRLIAAAVLGGLIGLERQIKHHSAGLRTNILVCIGSAAVMILSELLAANHFMKYGLSSDPSRMAAQVISGIGFLGAGTILHANSSVRGLTTAASLWTVACIGLVAGSGYYYFAFIVTFLVFVVLVVLNTVAKKIGRKNYMRRITIIAKPNAVVVGRIMDQLYELDIPIHDIEANLPVDNECVFENAEISFMPSNFNEFQETIKIMQDIDGVIKLVL